MLIVQITRSESWTYKFENGLFVFCRVNQKVEVRVIEVKNPDEKEFHKRLGTQRMTQILKPTHAHTATNHLGTDLLLQDIANYTTEIIVCTVSYVRKDLWTSDA